MHFGITEKPTTVSDRISLYNNAGLISKVYEKWPAKTLKIAVLDNPLSFDTLSPGNLRISA